MKTVTVQISVSVPDKTKASEVEIRCERALVREFFPEVAKQVQVNLLHRGIDMGVDDEG